MAERDWQWYKFTSIHGYGSLEAAVMGEVEVNGDGKWATTGWLLHKQSPIHGEALRLSSKAFTFESIDNKVFLPVLENAIIKVGSDKLLMVRTQKKWHFLTDKSLSDEDVLKLAVEYLEVLSWGTEEFEEEADDDF